MFQAKRDLVQAIPLTLRDHMVSVSVTSSPASGKSSSLVVVTLSSAAARDALQAATVSFTTKQGKQVNAVATPLGSEASAQQTNAPTSEGPSHGTVAGIVIGVLFAVCAIGFALVALKRRRHPKQVSVEGNQSRFGAKA